MRGEVPRVIFWRFVMFDFFKSKKAAIPLGMTTEEYVFIQELCEVWFIREQFLAQDAENITMTGYFNIATVNLLSADAVALAFSHDQQRHSTIRLVQLFANIVLRFGLARVSQWNTELQMLLASLGGDPDELAATFLLRPYLVLTPVLNHVCTSNLVTSNSGF
jgi:hypothetical protein